VNGTESGTSLGAPPPLATGLATTIGADSSGHPTHDLYFNGTIDEVAVYNTALSASQIHQHVVPNSASGQVPTVLHSQFQ